MQSTCPVGLPSNKINLLWDCTRVDVNKNIRITRIFRFLSRNLETDNITQLFELYEISYLEIRFKASL